MVAEALSADPLGANAICLPRLAELATGALIARAASFMMHCCLHAVRSA
jgi:hypothetical protein